MGHQRRASGGRIREPLPAPSVVESGGRPVARPPLAARQAQPQRKSARLGSAPAMVGSCADARRDPAHHDSVTAPTAEKLRMDALAASSAAGGAVVKSGPCGPYVDPAIPLNLAAVESGGRPVAKPPLAVRHVQPQRKSLRSTSPAAESCATARTKPARPNSAGTGCPASAEGEGERSVTQARPTNYPRFDRGGGDHATSPSVWKMSSSPFKATAPRAVYSRMGLPASGSAVGGAGPRPSPPGPTADQAVATIRAAAPRRATVGAVTRPVTSGAAAGAAQSVGEDEDVLPVSPALVGCEPYVPPTSSVPEFNIEVPTCQPAPRIPASCKGKPELWLCRGRCSRHLRSAWWQRSMAPENFLCFLDAIACARAWSRGGSLESSAT